MFVRNPDNDSIFGEDRPDRRDQHQIIGAQEFDHPAILPPIGMDLPLMPFCDSFATGVVKLRQTRPFGCIAGDSRRLSLWASCPILPDLSAVLGRPFFFASIFCTSCRWRRSPGMHLATNIVVAIAIGAVFVALLLGLANMLRGGSANTSQMFMRWRVGLQFVALLIILAVLYFRG